MGSCIPLIHQSNETDMETITLNNSIFATINCKGGQAVLCGIVVKETEKAVKIDYALEPVFASGAMSTKTFYNRTAWIPKSQIVPDGRGAFDIKKWFANNALKGFNIKPYTV